MIDSLFGSRTRVKLLHLFLGNPNKSFYVREITRLIDEQINSVRRELANMLAVGIIVSNSVDNKLYYSVSQKYEHFLPLREIFVGKREEAHKPVSQKSTAKSWSELLSALPGTRLDVVSGSLVRGSASPIDILVVGGVSQSKLASIMKKIEELEKRELNYALMSYEDFYYRLSVRDKFVSEVLTGEYLVLADTDGILS